MKLAQHALVLVVCLSSFGKSRKHFLFSPLLFPWLIIRHTCHNLARHRHTGRRAIISTGSCWTAERGELKPTAERRRITSHRLSLWSLNKLQLSLANAAAAAADTAYCADILATQCHIFLHSSIFGRIVERRELTNTGATVEIEEDEDKDKRLSLFLVGDARRAHQARDTPH